MVGYADANGAWRMKTLRRERGPRRGRSATPFSRSFVAARSLRRRSSRSREVAAEYVRPSRASSQQASGRSGRSSGTAAPRSPCASYAWGAADPEDHCRPACWRHRAARAIGACAVDGSRDHHADAAGCSRSQCGGATSPRTRFCDSIADELPRGRAQSEPRDADDRRGAEAARRVPREVPAAARRRGVHRHEDPGDPRARLG